MMTKALKKGKSKVNTIIITVLGAFCITLAAFRPDMEKYLSLNNDSRILEANHIPDLDLTREITLEAWININGNQLENTRIIDKYQSSGAGGYLLGIGTGNKLWMTVGANQITASTALPFGKWCHVAGIFDQPKGIFKLFLDGKEVASNMQKNLRLANHTVFPVRIGSDAEGLNTFHGSISKIAIYKQALAAEEVTGLAQNMTANHNFHPLVEWDLANDGSKGFTSVTANKLKLGFLKPLKGIEPAGVNNMVLWYKYPADRWTEALPIGNGRFGAMVFSGPERERLQLNDITVWSGSPQPDADRKDAYKHLDTIRKAIHKGDYKEAEKLTSSYLTSPAPYDASYQTLGDMSLQFVFPGDSITGYSRWLNIDKAITGVKFKSDGVTFNREVFSSAPDGVMVEHLTSSKKAGLSFNVNLNRLEKAQTTFIAPNKLLMTGNTGNTLTYEVQVTIVNNGGTVKGEGNSLVVENADAVTLLVTSGTSYLLNYEKDFKGINPHHDVTKRMTAALLKSYEQLKNNHIKEYQKYFHRVNFTLSTGNAAHIPTDERLKAYKDGLKDPAFVSLFYQFGRYLLISSSRPDNPLPSNSQGIWGDGLNLPWKCDYKSNINYQMNYWPVEQTNLSELHMPMIKMTQLAQGPGTKTAKVYYGPNTPGWTQGYTTNAWGWTSPGAALPWGVFAGGSGWVCQDLWEHYTFNRDKVYLKSVYPTLKGAAEFYLATMVKDKDGYLITSPSTSPENNFITESGLKSNVTEGATMERSIIWDLLNNVVRASAALNYDSDFRKKVIAARDQIRPLQIGKAGQLMEWNKDWDLNSDDMRHRHVSHLFPLYPGHQITAFGTPNLVSAAKKTLELRGDDGTGWSIAWKENFWAMLRDGNHAHKLLSDQLRFTGLTKVVMADAGGTYPNLFDAHPPFQIDGNLGAVAGITELLLQSQESFKTIKGEAYVLDILPALPDAWDKGAISGLKGRGGFEVSINWNKGHMVSSRIKSLAGEACKIRANVPFKIAGITAKAIPENGNFTLTINTKKGGFYELSAL